MFVFTTPCTYNLVMRKSSNNKQHSPPWVKVMKNLLPSMGQKKKIMNHRSAAIEIHNMMTPWIFHAVMTTISPKTRKD